MKLPNKIYDALKWITILFLPALAALYVGLAEVWGWPYADQVSRSAPYIETFFGVVLGISTLSYNEAKRD